MKNYFAFFILYIRKRFFFNLKKYAQFLLEQEDVTVQKGKLFIETDNGVYDDWTYSNDWLLLFNIVILWNKFESGQYSFQEFNQKYADFIISSKNIIEKNAGNECYLDLEKEANKLKESKDEEESNSTYESIYEICDKCGIFIKCYETDEIY